MKKFFVAAMAVVCMCATSCTSDRIERAYLAEMNYRSVKGVMGGAAAEQRYKEEFLLIWHSMTDEERMDYENYKTSQESMAEQARAIEAEGLRMLNE